MRKYDTYKDSGIEWIGEIPSHWEVKKVNYCFEQIGSGTTPTAGKPEFYENGEFNWLQTGDLNDNEIYETSKKITQEALNEYSTLKFYPENSLVIAMYGATIGKTGLLKIESTTNQACCVLSKPKGLNQRFAFYWLNYVKPHIISLSYGGGQPNINQEQIRSLKIQCPTFQEQTAIAAYLDRKTAEIDELIADKKRLLELYEEEKTAIINQAVTKGINPDAPMKDSGIEWLGEIPEHWEVKRLSWCFEIIGSGTTPKAGSEEYYLNGEFNWLLTGDLTDGDILETSKKVTQKALDDHSSLKKYPVNSIVMAMYGATIGKLGILKIPTTVNQACCVMGSPIHLHYQFAFFLLLAARKEIINMSYGGGQPNISQELIKSFRVQVPPFEEQQSIVHHIETESAQIDAKRAKTEKLIELLTEYRTALISEVVTGKIKVTD